MPQIPVINPPDRRHGAARGTMKHKKKKASRAQLAALARGRKALAAKRVHASRPAKRRRRKNPVSVLAKAGKHRPVVIVKKGRLHRPRRSTIKPHMTFANPFLGELAIMNPRKHRKHAVKHHRRTHRRGLMFRNPGFAAVLAGPKEMIRLDFIKEAASIAAGFILPNMVIVRLPANWRNATWKVYTCKVVTVAALSAGAAVISKRLSRLVLIGGGVSLLMDLYADFLAPRIAGLTAGAAAPVAPTAGMYYGEEGGVGTYYGEAGGMSDSAGSLAEAFAS